MRLAELHARIRACTKCVAAGYLERARAVVAGSMRDRIAIVGQAPGAVELTTGQPFSGRSGAELRRWLAGAGIDEDHLPYRTAITKCFPGKSPTGSGDRRPSPAEIALCASWLDEELALLKPKVILLLGGLAIDRFWGKVPLEDAVGRSRVQDGVTYIPLPHPSGASRWLNDAAHRRLLDRALRLVAREVRAFLKTSMMKTPSYSPRVRSLRWTLATAGGFALGGVALHSPGASAVGASYLDWDVSAAAFGAILGSIVGVITALLQIFALGVRSWRLAAASVVAVAVAHGLADGAPAAWGVGIVAAISGLSAAIVLAWALRTHAWRWIIASAFAWWAGWLMGVAIAGGLGLSNGTTQAAWATEHAVIAGILGLAWGSATSPHARRLLEGRVLLSTAPI